VTAGYWRDRPTFVTAGTGLLAGWLTRALVEQGADVVCLTRDGVPQCELARVRMTDQVKVVRGDLRDGALLERVLGEYEIDAVFHVGAQAIVGIANRSPVATFESNIQGTWNLLEACRHSPKVRTIVVASSDKAYGEHADLPCSEDTPLRGKHPYEVSKSCADLIAQSYAVSFGLPVAITRCGNFYGGGDLNWSRIVPGTIRSVLRGEPPLIRSDGHYIRDYFYVEDGAAAHILLAEKLAADERLKGLAFNFSNEQQITVLELVNLILHKLNSSLVPVVENQVSQEIRNQYLSAARARQMLAWKPLFTLDEGLERTIDWYRKALANGQG
jgi:CDP-glucose 4,6-dehydratase